MDTIRRHMNSVPRGVPQIYGAALAVLILGAMMALRVRLGGFQAGINWESLLEFAGLNGIIALVSVMTRRSAS